MKTPQRMSYKPREKETSIEFMETFFQKLETDLDTDFKQKINEMSFINIQQAKEFFYEWREITFMQQNTVY